jgi:hypothetical protein
MFIFGAIVLRIVHKWRDKQYIGIKGLFTNDVTTLHFISFDYPFWVIEYLWLNKGFYEILT